MRPKRGIDGYAGLSKLEAKHGALPETWTISTLGGGEERYFLVLCPHRAHERPSWLANYTWSEELVAWKPTEYEVAAALGSWVLIGRKLREGASKGRIEVMVPGHSFETAMKGGWQGTEEAPPEHVFLEDVLSLFTVSKCGVSIR